jgi:hypothetical protein
MRGECLTANNSLHVSGENQIVQAVQQVWTFRNPSPLHLVPIFNVVMYINRYSTSTRCRPQILKLLFLMYPLVLF